jgi:hypothetical protein
MCSDIFCSMAKALGECQDKKEEILPSGKKEISFQEKEAFLKARFPGVQLLLTYQHILPTYDDIAYFLARDQTNKYAYVMPDYICSSYAIRLAGQFSIPKWSELTFGLVWTDKHALNCVITEDMQFYFAEPQTDELQTELKEWQGSQIRFIMI